MLLTSYTNDVYNVTRVCVCVCEIKGILKRREIKGLRVNEIALNYRLRFCTMSIGTRHTAHGTRRSPYAPAPHSDTPLHGGTEATVCWHTHLSLAYSLLTRPHPPLLGRSAALPLLVLLSLWMLSSL